MLGAIAALAPSPVAAEPAYPRPPVARPFLLPPGATEGALRLVLGRLDLGDRVVRQLALEPRLRQALGPAELEVGARLLVDEHDDGADPRRGELQALTAAARWRLTDDRALTIDLELDDLDVVPRAVRGRAVIDQRWHLAARSAAEVGGGLGLEDTDENPFWSEPAMTALLVDVRARVEAQVAPAVAVEAHAHARARRPFDLPADTPGGHASLTLASGVGVVVSLTNAIDLVGAVDLVRDGEHVRYSVGVVARRLP